MTTEGQVETTVEAPGPASSSGGRMSLVSIDQGLSSISNLLVLMYVAHVLTPVDFGRFSLMFVVYALGQALVRSMVSLPILVHPEDARERPRTAIGSAALLGATCGALCLLVALVMWLIGDHSAPSVLVLAICLPFLLVHDAGRYLGFARTRPGDSITLDSIWLVLAIVGFGVADRLHTTSLPWIVLAWAGAGAVASWWVLTQAGVPRPADFGLDWMRAKWSFVWRSLISNTAAQGVGLLGALLAAAVSSPVAVAVVRSSLLIGRPSATVQAGVGASTAADVARERPADGGRRMMWRALVVCLVVALGNMAVLLVLPDWAGRLVLGEVWPLVKPLVVPIGLFGLAAAVHTAVQAVLLGRHEMTTVLRLEILGACATVVCLVVGAARWNAAGALWGTTIGQTIAAVAWWIVFHHARRARGRPAHRATRHERGR